MLEQHHTDAGDSEFGDEVEQAATHVGDRINDKKEQESNGINLTH
jgi:hypothetical protein